MSGDTGDIRDLPGKKLVLAGVGALQLEYDWLSDRCVVLRDDAFARVNGRPMSLFRGAYHVTPPMGDDGTVDCSFPGAYLNEIPADLPPPWTVEIGDGSQVVSATIGLALLTEFEIQPLIDPPLRSSFVQVNVPITFAGDVDPSPAVPKITLTASDGRTTTSYGTVYAHQIGFGKALPPQWPVGPVSVRVEVDFTTPQVLLGCENAECRLAGAPYFSPELEQALQRAAPRSPQLPTTFPVTAEFESELACDTTDGFCF